MTYPSEVMRSIITARITDYPANGWDVQVPVIAGDEAVTVLLSNNLGLSVTHELAPGNIVRFYGKHVSRGIFRADSIIVLRQRWRMARPCFSDIAGPIQKRVRAMLRAAQ